MLIYCEKKKTVLTENWINHVKEVIKNIENLLDIKIERSETNRLVKAHISLTNVTDKNFVALPILIPLIPIFYYTRFTNMNNFRFIYNFTA